MRLGLTSQLNPRVCRMYFSFAKLYTSPLFLKIHNFLQFAKNPTGAHWEGLRISVHWIRSSGTG